MSTRLVTTPWLTKNFALGTLDTTGLLGKTSGAVGVVDGSADAVGIDARIATTSR
jgi:hypothetical protein